MQFPWLQLLPILRFHDSPFRSQPHTIFPNFFILSSEVLPSIGSHHPTFFSFMAPIEGVILHLLGGRLLKGCLSLGISFMVGRDPHLFGSSLNIHPWCQH